MVFDGATHPIAPLLRSANWISSRAVPPSVPRASGTKPEVEDVRCLVCGQHRIRAPVFAPMLRNRGRPQDTKTSGGPPSGHPVGAIRYPPGARCLVQRGPFVDGVGCDPGAAAPIWCSRITTSFCVVQYGSERQRWREDFAIAWKWVFHGPSCAEVMICEWEAFVVVGGAAMAPRGSFIFFSWAPNLIKLLFGRLRNRRQRCRDTPACTQGKTGPPTPPWWKQRRAVESLGG